MVCHILQLQIFYMKTIINDNDPKPLAEAKRLMGKLEVPLLRHELSRSILNKIKIQLPSLFNPENVLKSLYLIKKHTFFNAYEMLSQDDFNVLFKILNMVSYSSVCNKEYIKELPIFTTIANKMVSLVSVSQIWIWNDKKVCTTRVDQWISQVPDDIIFLTPSAPWSCLKHEAENLGMLNINSIYWKNLIINFYCWFSLHID